LTTAEIRAVLEDVAYHDGDAAWKFHVGEDWTHGYPARPWLQVRFKAPCNVGGQPAAQHGRKWRLSPHMTRSEIVLTALKAVLTAVEHEARERFTYRGLPIFGPHVDVDALHTVVAEHEPAVRS